ncbi:nucleoside-diphosphate kinase [Planctomicrobium sp. SH661]|uniref:nucleoside-diphosphate kinase n=1 Tax=Planctomicrobium sp. SH661 TaxID=3448124 RepID=UPI003F5C6497
MNQSLVILKPDAIERRLVSNLLSRFEQQGFEFGNITKRYLTLGEVSSLYCQYIEKDFMPRLRGTMLVGPCLLVPVGRVDACVSRAREIALEARLQLRDPQETNPARNLIHASDSVSAAVRELQLFFPGTE